ncbi:MAG: glutamate--tRNA ligase [Eubacteriales bacterium]|nr:glutamate--tRNA ligase [Eubacteriales bacterium]
MTVKVRFAPSPTGPLHIGGARTVLFNWLFARRNKGIFVLRSEDTDLERSSEKWERDIAASLHWLGLDWDEGLEVGGPNGPYRQTQRLEIYKEYLSRLWLGEHVYYCFCTPEELARDREEAMARGDNPVYSGRCRRLTPAQIEEKLQAGLKPTIRFKVPEDTEILIDDLIRGQVSFQSCDVGDFIIFKSDGIPTYNYAVVIDDITMGITHIIRANEHLVNTPRQVLIYQALGEKMPEFGHVSVVLDTSGRKMSKRMGDMSVGKYARQGYLPEAVVNFMALLGWSPEDSTEIMTIEELVEAFDLSRISKSPGIFDAQKLDWMNNQYIRASNLDRLADLAMPFLEAEGLTQGISREWLKYVIAVVRDELQYLAQLPNFVKEFFAGTVQVQPEALPPLQLETTGMVLDEFLARLGALPQTEDLPLQQQQVQAMLKQLNKDLKTTAGVSGKAVYMPIRAALTGAVSGQELYYLVPILGKERAVARIKSSRQQAGI